jgi:mRNA interferase MazF
MKRGEVWWVDFDTSVGSEPKKRRPAIVVSNDSSNRFLNRVQVVPVTSNASKLYPSEAYVNINGRQGKAQANQLMTVSEQRFRGLIRQISSKELGEIERAIAAQLGLTR